MKIYAIVRTLNEEKNLPRFWCAYHRWVDKIIVADGGSIDSTIRIAESLPKVTLLHFHEREELNNGYWKNPADKHINFLIDYATDDGADWVIFDDCDNFPNSYLQKNGRTIIESTEADHVYAVRLFLWGKDKFFPNLSKNNNEWAAGLWAWRTKLNLRFIWTKPGHSFAPKPKYEDVAKALPPMCLLHNPWPDEETVQEKLNFYRQSGWIEGMLHPLEFGGPLEDLPEWARE